MSNKEYNRESVCKMEKELRKEILSTPRWRNLQALSIDKKVQEVDG